MKAKTITSERLKQIPISQIFAAKWDIRRYPEAPDEFNTLVQSIEKDGLLNPITVCGSKGKYVLVAGRRRLKACKLLGMKEVSAYIKDESANEAEYHRLTLVENLHRRELIDIEKGYGILKVFEDEGYPNTDTRAGLKALEGWFITNTGGRKDWDKFYKSFINLPKQGHKASKERYDKNFAQICQSIGYTPAYQYRLVRMVMDVNEQTLKVAEEKKLSFTKKELLAHSKLKSHPTVQKALASQIEKLSDDQAVDKVHQTINDLETGYIKPTRDGYYYTSKERENVKDRSTETVEYYDTFIDIKAKIVQLLYKMTDIKLSKQIKYSKGDITATNPHRLKIVKALNNDLRDINQFKEWYLEPLKQATEDFIDLLNTEIEISDKKVKMGSR